jgi:hypothetical protein
MFEIYPVIQDSTFHVTLNSIGTVSYLLEDVGAHFLETFPLGIQWHLCTLRF